jgi:hypothetical protein
MKSKFGTALALVGVLLTGTAAAAINTQALISPSQSTLGTAATTLLPIDQAVAVVPGQQATPVQTSAAGQSQDQVVRSPAPKQNASAVPTASTPAINKPTASKASAPKSPLVVYVNPNLSQDDDYEDDEDDEDDEDEDDD